MTNKMERLEADLAVAKAEAKFRDKKTEGQARIAKARAAAFTKAKDPEEYKLLISAIPPALPMKEKLALRELRKAHRERYPAPVGPGAAPETAIMKGKVS